MKYFNMAHMEATEACIPATSSDVKHSYRVSKKFISTNI